MLARPHMGSACVAFWITGEATRTPDLRIMRPQTGFRKDPKGQRLASSTPRRSHHIPTDNCQNDPELTAVIEAWDRLPEAVRAGIVAMVKAAVGVKCMHSCLA